MCTTVLNHKRHNPYLVSTYLNNDKRKKFANERKSLSLFNNPFSLMTVPNNYNAHDYNSIPSSDIIGPSSADFSVSTLNNSRRISGDIW